MSKSQADGNLADILDGGADADDIFGNADGAAPCWAALVGMTCPAVTAIALSTAGQVAGLV